MITAVTEEPIRPPSDLRPDIPRFLEDCILKALSRERNQRYQHAGQMRDDLQQFLTMSSRGNEREELGRYVSEMFVAEQDEIAQVLRHAAEGELTPTPLGSLRLENLGDGRSSTATDAQAELEVPMPEPEVEAEELDHATAHGSEDTEASDATSEDPTTGRTKDRNASHREPVNEKASDAKKPAKTRPAPSNGTGELSSSTSSEAIPEGSRRVNSRITAEFAAVSVQVRRLRRRQAVLLFLLFAITVIAGVLAFLQFAPMLSR